MTKIVSFINLKGGVGKTTTVVNIAAVLAQSGKSVLLVDLDPQTNATVSVIDQEQWDKRHKAGQTLYHLFNGMLNPNGKDGFDISKAIMKGVGDVDNLDLLPSSFYLVEIQDQIAGLDNFYVSPVDILHNAISPAIGEYDYVLIDCPPSLGVITLNGISISDYYVVPTIPDILSKIGINLIDGRIKDFKAKKPTCTVEFGGIIFTKVDKRTNLHASTKKELRSGGFKEAVFSAEITQRTGISEAPSDSKPIITSRAVAERSDKKEIYGMFEDVTSEFAKRIGG